MNPDDRSRLVAKDINVDKREELYAATPPLEAKNMMCSIAVADGLGYVIGKPHLRKKCVFIDIWKAYFLAAASRDVYVELPEEDMEEGYCGKLEKSGYRTRDAALNWEFEYSPWM